MRDRISPSWYLTEILFEVSWSCTDHNTCSQGPESDNDNTKKISSRFCSVFVGQNNKIQFLAVALAHLIVQFWPSRCHARLRSLRDREKVFLYETHASWDSDRENVRKAFGNLRKVLGNLQTSSEMIGSSSKILILSVKISRP